MNYLNKHKHVFILISLFLLWIFLTIFYIFKFNFSPSVISYTYGEDNFSNYTNEKLLKNQKISGSFIAEENNLGIITLNFNPSNDVSFSDEDILIFRIKEDNSDKWLYEKKIRSGLVNLSPNLPIGFPIISDSKGKVYIFELESLWGNEFNAVSMKRFGSPLVVKYKFSRQELLSDKYNLINFQLKKIYLSFKNQNVFFFSFIYILPFLFYIFYSHPFVKHKVFPRISESVQKNKYKLEKLNIPRTNILPFEYFFNFLESQLHIFILILVLINIFLVNEINDLALIVLIGIWIYILDKYSIEFRYTFIVGIGLLIGSFINYYFYTEEMSEKFAIWAFMFFVAGAIQIFLGLRKPGKYSLSK